MFRSKNINYYSHRRATRSSGVMTLEDIFHRIQKSNIDIPKAERRGYTFNTNTRLGRREVDVINFTGLMFIDIDHCIDSIGVKELFTAIDNCVAVWLSSSHENVHALISIPICQTKSEFHLRFRKFGDILEPYLDGLVEEPKDNERRNRLFDDTAKDITRLAFESSDSDIWVNYDAEVFRDILEPELEYKAFVPNTLSSESNFPQDKFFQILSDKVMLISGDGFGNVRGLSTWFGASCKDNGYNEMESLNCLIGAIGSNDYLSSKDSSGTIALYIKTAKTGFEFGYNNNLNIKVL